MSKMNLSTFAADRTDGEREIGTVEVTLGGKTQRCPANRYADGTVVASGLVGRYQQGAKAWPATIMNDGKRPEYVSFGRDDRSGRFRKENCIYFA